MPAFDPERAFRIGATNGRDARENGHGQKGVGCADSDQSSVRSSADQIVSEWALLVARRPVLAKDRGYLGFIR